MCNGVWNLRGGCRSNMSSYLTYAIGVGNYPTMTRTVHSGYKAKVRWQWRIDSLDHGLERRNLTNRRNRWWKYKDMMLHCIKHKIQQVVVFRI